MAIIPIRMTQYSAGSGCGCKLSPATLETILKNSLYYPDHQKLIVGNHSADDAAVYDIGQDQYLIFTTDFFTPIVDDAFDYGYIAAVNAINDVYAMGGRPIMALGILAWPIDHLSAEQARLVVDGGRAACQQAGIPLAGGHSIENPEPVFGLAVTGLVSPAHLRTNNSGKEGDSLFLTKALGTGLLTTAEKKSLVRSQDYGLAAAAMKKFNSIGTELAKLPEVHALTDVTGFGLLGHLLEICQHSNTRARVDYRLIRQITDLKYYVEANCLAGGLLRNWQSYGAKITNLPDPERSILCDPQTSGGLLFSVAQSGISNVQEILETHGLTDFTEPIGILLPEKKNARKIEVTGVSKRSFQTNPIVIPKQTAAHPLLRGDCSAPIPAQADKREIWLSMKAFFSDLWKMRKKLRRQSWIKKYARKHGLTVNPHFLFQYNLRLWLIESEETFGKRYCPCFEPGDNEEINRKMVCPCDFIKDDIQEKGSCHCTLFGGKDLDSQGFKEAEKRLMQEYRVKLSYFQGILDTRSMPLDKYRLLKIPDVYHLTKRAVMLHGLPVKVFTEKMFETENLRLWANYKNWQTEVQASKDPEGFIVTIFS